MPDTTSLVINVKSDSVTKATKNLKGLGVQAKKTATATGRFGKTTGGSAAGLKKATVATNGLATATKKLLLPLAAILGPIAAFRKLLGAGVEIGKWRAQLETATGSVEAASAAFDNLEQFASKTPFALEQSITAFTKLKNFGLDPSNEAMMSYGNTASAMGKDLNQMIEAIADAATGEFERLKEFGIKAKSEGDKVSFTFRGITTTVGKNAAEIEGYIRDIGDVEFAGAMTKQMDTIGGKLSNLGDSWGTLWRTIAEAGVADAIGNAFTKTSAFLADLTEKFKNGQIPAYIKSWGVVMDQFADIVGDAMDVVGDALKPGTDEDNAENWIINYSRIWGDFFIMAGMGFAAMATAMRGITAEAGLSTLKHLELLPMQTQHSLENLKDFLSGRDNSDKSKEAKAGRIRAIQATSDSFDNENSGLANDSENELREIVKKARANGVRYQELLDKASGKAMFDIMRPEDEPFGPQNEEGQPNISPNVVAVPNLLERPEDEVGAELGPDEQTIYEKQAEKLAERLARKQEQIDQADKTALEKNKEFNEKKAAQDKKDAKDLAEYQHKAKLSSAANLAEGLADLAAVFGKKGAVAHKVLATTAATIDMYAGATAAMAAPELPFSTRAIAAAGVIAAGMASIASINSAGSYANGGIIPGNSTSGDRLQANVNSGEMILNQKQQANLFKIADGGSNSGGNVTVNNYGNDNVETKTDSDGNMQIIIRQAADLAKSELADEVNTGAGDFAPMMQNTFGLSRGV